MGFLKLRLPEERPSRNLQDKGSQAGAWKPAKVVSVHLSSWERGRLARPMRAGYPRSQGGLNVYPKFTPLCKRGDWYIRFKDTR